MTYVRFWMEGPKKGYVGLKGERLLGRGGGYTCHVYRLVDSYESWKTRRKQRRRGGGIGRNCEDGGRMRWQSALAWPFSCMGPRAIVQVGCDNELGSRASGEKRADGRSREWDLRWRGDGFKEDDVGGRSGGRGVASTRADVTVAASAQRRDIKKGLWTV